MGPTLNVIMAVATAASAVGSYASSTKAAKLSNQQQALANRRSVRQSIREAQIRRAQTTNIASQFGGLGGSAVDGGLSSLSSQLGSGLGYSSQQSGLSAGISRANANAAMFGSLGSLSSKGFSISGGAPVLYNTLFPAKSPTPAPTTSQASRNGY